MSWHPWIVHYAIALLPVGVLVDLAAVFWRRPAWHTTGYALLLLGTAAAAAAVITGNQAALPYRDDEAVSELVQRHDDWGSAAFILFLAILLGRLPLQLRGRTQGRALRCLVIAALAGCGVLYTASLYGGELVYRHGVGVQRQGAGSGTLRQPLEEARGTGPAGVEISR